MKKIFNNCNPRLNGELDFYNRIKDSSSVLFDVGCRKDSLFTNFTGIVHYFDPVKEPIEALSRTPNKNEKSFFNNFGLGDSNRVIDYYPKFQSFFSREPSLGRKASGIPRVQLEVRTAREYILKENVSGIDFLKIDTEGYELGVMKGFGGFLKNVKVIQFEYGGCNIDSNTKLNDIVSYLSMCGFYNFAYLCRGGSVKLEDLEEKVFRTNPQSHRHRHPKTVKGRRADGVIPDHYNYSNLVCSNSNFKFVK